MFLPEATSLLVDLELKPGMFDPVDAPKFSADLASAINRVALDKDLRAAFEKKGGGFEPLEATSYFSGGRQCCLKKDERGSSSQM